MSESKEVDEAMKLSSSKKGVCTRAINFALNLARNINTCRDSGHQPAQVQLDKLQRYLDDVEPKYKLAHELLLDLEALGLPDPKGKKRPPQRLQCDPWAGSERQP